MKSFFKNAVDEIVRRRIDQIEMEMTENPAQYPEFASALQRIGWNGQQHSIRAGLAVEAYKQGFRDGVQAYQALIVK